MSVSSLDSIKDLVEQGGNVVMKPLPMGKGFLRNMWYFALPSSDLKCGQMKSKTILDEPLLIGRDKDGKVFALRDICPHQAVPLSEGRFDGQTLSCCFHGWTFGTDGVCTGIPSLVKEQSFKTSCIKTRAYNVKEVQGSIWIYFGEKEEDLPPVPTAPNLADEIYAKTTTTLIIPTHIDFAAVALIDPAHVPYVHKSWWWRSAKSMKEKSKRYVPSEMGWTMVKHKPAAHSILFKLFGKYIETEISFCLPGCRREYITFNGRTIISGISKLTPIDATHTELNHTTYWTVLPILRPLVKPIVDYLVNEFLSQDLDIARMQAKVLKYEPELIPLIKDAGVPGRWYLQLKQAWRESTELGKPFVNPVRDTILRWMS